MPTKAPLVDPHSAAIQSAFRSTLEMRASSILPAPIRPQGIKSEPPTPTHTGDDPIR